MRKDRRRAFAQLVYLESKQDKLDVDQEQLETEVRRRGMSAKPRVVDVYDKANMHGNT